MAQERAAEIEGIALTHQPFTPAPDAIRARWAVSVVFLLNGLSFSAILPRLPEIVTRLGISNTELGIAVALGPLGGLMVGLAAAAIMARIGSAKTAIVFQVLASTAHLAIYVAPSLALLAAGFIVASAADSITDVAQNMQGMRVERRYKRSIMNSYHGFWSLGAVLGGMIGSLCAQLHVPLWAQGLAGVIVYGLVAILNGPFLLPGHDGTEREVEAAAMTPASANDVTVLGSERDNSASAAGEARAKKRAPIIAAAAGRSPRMIFAILCALGMILVFAGATEDAGGTWGALYMRSTFDAIPLVAGLAFVALQGAQMVGRFFGDALVDRWGDRKTARIGASIAAIGMTCALLVPSPVTSLIGFAAAGWGVATLFPAVFRASDEIPGLRNGVGISVVAWFARIGIFVAPPLVGFLADALTLRYALWLMPVYAVGIFVFAGAFGKKASAPHAA